jgi:hypothetical protein
MNTEDNGMADPYACLSEIARSLWNLSQHTSGPTSAQAQAMYDRLEDEYLEPFRMRRIRQNTQQYAQLTASLQKGITAINEQVRQINQFVDNVQKVAQYAAIFDQIIGVAAKLLV